MGKKAAPKTQSSITSFFGAGAPTPPPKKRKPADGDEDKALKKPKKEKKKTEKKEKKVVVEEEEEEKEKQVEEEPEDVEMQDGQEEEEDAAKEEEEEEEEVAKSKTKPGRRRLRQRVVEEEDEDSDVELPMSTEKKTAQEEVIDMTSPTSTPEKTMKKETKKNKTPVKPKSPKKEEKKSVKPPSPKEEDEPEEVEEAKDEEVEEVEAEEVEKVKDEKVEEAEEVKPKKEVKKETTSPAAKASFFSPVSSKKSKVKTTSADDKKEKNAKTEPNLKTKTEVTETQDDESDEPRETPYFALAHLFAKIEEVSGRLVIQDLLTAFFRDVIRRSPDDLLACIYLCVCVDLAPPFENLKIGIGDAILMKAIGEATGANLKFIKEMYHKEGDLGKVAQNARSKQKTLSFTSTKPATSKGTGLTVQHVYDQFVKIAKMTGNNSQQQKCSIIKGLLVKCEKEKKSQANGAQSAEGAKFIIRGLQGKLRIGLAEKSILMGLTYAFMTEKAYKDKEKQQEALAFVKKAFAECPSYNALVAAFHEVQKEVPSAPFLRVKDFAQVAEKCVLTPGTPVSPMLARPTKAYAMVFDRFEGKPFTCEYKYDGERAQIHILPNGEIAIFSRNFENSTERFPDVKLAISEATKKKGIVESCIVDAEVVAVDRATNKRLPFQILSTRSRKNVKVEDIKIPVCIYAFDLLFLNDVEDCMDVKNNPEAMDEAVDKVRNFLEEAVRENCEGLMVKTLEKEATYEPANRSHKWLKLKKDYLDGIGDSADLVPIDTEMYQPITKLGTGLSDEVLKKFYDQLKEKVVDKPPSDYAIGEGIKPDVWFEASCVWEILGADLSISPKYTAAIGLVAKDKGISLRFPRFIRIRDDKDTTQATNSSQIADLYRAQGLATVTNGDEEEDDMLI
ncbi:DNA ligase 1 [Phytophthora fragariae]|uniref:DNA ligase n=1 Tax=Phytophthora fragariae TaxID=53985 RepID=A0A6A4E1T6_9STRA|nr:DNA ligase 1 [Phytophthora fragariae]KAE9318186.1 DNA ligase 1 [Phytophthora fragariae]